MANPFCSPSLWKACSQLVQDPDGYQMFSHFLFWWVPPGSQPGPCPGSWRGCPSSCNLPWGNHQTLPRSMD